METFKIRRAHVVLLSMMIWEDVSSRQRRAHTYTQAAMTAVTEKAKINTMCHDFFTSVGCRFMTRWEK